MNNPRIKIITSKSIITDSVLDGKLKILKKH